MPMLFYRQLGAMLMIIFSSAYLLLIQLMGLDLDSFMFFFNFRYILFDFVEFKAELSDLIL